MAEQRVYSDSDNGKRAYNDDNQILLSVDEDMNFPIKVSARQAERFKDASTPEGKALKSVIAEELKGVTPGTGTGGGSTLTPDKDNPGLYIIGE